jgi:hypothetical protein
LNKDEAQPEQEPVNPLDDKTIAALIEASGIELDDDHVLEDQTIYYVDASTLFGLVRKVEKMFQPRMSTYTTPPQRPWVEPTDDDIDRVTDAQWTRNIDKPIYAAHRAYARAIAAVIKEKNT